MARVGMSLSGISYASLIYASVHHPRLTFMQSVHRAFMDPHKLIGPAAAILPTVAMHNQLAVITASLVKCTQRFVYRFKEASGHVEGHDEVKVKPPVTVLSRCRDLVDSVENARFVENDAEMWENAMELVDRGVGVHLAFQDEALHNIPPELGEQGFVEHASGK
jgi:hypothetical protein